MSQKVKKLEDILQKYYGKPVKLSDVHYQELQRVPIADQPHSTIHIQGHCKVKKQGEEVIDLWLFIKLSPSCYMPFRLVQELNIIPRFQKELHAYSIVLPELTRFQTGEASTNFRVDDLYQHIFPKCYGTRLSLNPDLINYPDQDGVIVLRNAKHHRYEEPDHVVGLNLETAKILSGKLALFHSVPLAFKIKHGEAFLEKIQPCLMITNVTSECFVTVPSEVEMIREVIINTGLMGEYQDRINKALAYSAEFMSVPPTDDDWIGMCHGKFFVFNTLIKRSTEKVITDCRIIDLQHLLRRHILTDLAFLLITCSAKNLLINHLEEILHHYHKIFIEILRRLDVDLTPYDYDKFRTEFKEQVRKELLRGLQMIRFMAAKKDQIPLMRSLATWPRFDKDRVEAAIDQKLYIIKMKDIMLNLLQTRLIDED